MDNTYKRILIYTIYDNTNIVDNYIINILNNIKPFLNRLIIVINKNTHLISEINTDILKHLNAQIIIRDNIGFDIWGYKTGLDAVSINELQNTDEIILMNDTLLGPIIPLNDMFDKMDKKTLDFWGLTLFHSVPFDPFGTIKYGYIPTHIQSSFMVFRKSLFLSKHFREYWENLPAFNTYQEAVGMHECIFTKHFEDLGYKWDVYVDTRKEEGYTFYPLLHNPVKVLEEYKCPFFKRRSFFHNYNDYIDYTNGDQAYNLYNYIKNYTNYNTDYIWENILRTCNINDIYNTMHLNYIPADESQSYSSHYKAGIFIHIDNEQFLPLIKKYIEYIPESIDIYITLSESIKNININRNHILLSSSINQLYPFANISAYIKNYDILCFIHNKPIPNSFIRIKEEAFLYKAYESMIGSNNHILNIINIFSSNKYLGLLIPYNANFGEYYKNTLNNISNNDFEYLQSKLKQIGIQNNNYSQSNSFMHNCFEMFWCKKEAVCQIFNTDNPLNTQYILPLIAQYNGFYTGRVISSNLARIEIDNLTYMLQETNKKFINKIDFINFNHSITSIQNLISKKNIFKKIMKRIFKV